MEDGLPRQCGSPGEREREREREREKREEERDREAGKAWQVAEEDGEPGGTLRYSSLVESGSLSSITGFCPSYPVQDFRIPYFPPGKYLHGRHITGSATSSV